ncbi:sulfatase [Kiritimatiella glycovorans]|uniref:Arylsulfatase n=1 Tax=Kiritimatiella glycovorans TaxID=1307763 RepID=A0A0G3EGS0_9BACT|nr:sulfatase [Kiritimatiella glycovorans]AKJ64622.1 Arylsulfatase [Kiritimatiella glycovorans]
MIRKFALISALMVAHLSAAAAKEKPNVVFIVADDLGYGDLGCYGCEDIRTPSLDRLAAGGVRLTQGYVSAPYCGPSRAGFMTGRYQQRHGYWRNPGNWPVDRTQGLDLEEETMADLLRRGGYRTCAIAKWHLGAAEQFHPINRGFDEFFGFLTGGHQYFPEQYEKSRLRWSRDHSDTETPYLYHYTTPLQINGVELPEQEGYLTDQLTDYAIGFMKRAEEGPFFIYLPFNAPHVPLEAPAETIAKYESIGDEKRRTYAAMVDNLDMNIGRLLDHLEETGQRANTLVVFISDNGGKPQNGGFNGPLRGHKGQVYEGGVRVPFIVSWPAALPAGRVCATPIISLDLLPTFAAASGVEPGGKPLDGVNVLPWLRGTADGRPHEALFWERAQQRGMREGDWKAVRRTENGRWRLYELNSDPGEENDLSTQHPERLEAMKARYAEWWDTLAPSRWEDPKY